MRLFRRSLLCLVVGVTAFGAAGWGFRPRAKWSVAMQEPGFTRFEFHENRSVKSPPGLVWLWSARTTETDEREDMLFGIDEATGRVARRIRWPTDEMVVPLPDGRVLYTHETKSFDQTRVVRTNLRLTDPDARLIAEHEWDGGWELTADGLKAWDFRWRKEGFSLVVRDVVTGEIIRTHRFDGEYAENAAYQCDISPDAKLVAVGDRVFKNERPPYGVQFWDVESGKLLKRLRLPSTGNASTDEGASNPHISTTHPVVFFAWQRKDLDETRDWKWAWRYDSAKENDIEREAPPVSIVRSDVRLRKPSVDGVDGKNWLWTTFDEDRSQVWFSIQDDRGEVQPWRKFPFPIRPIEHGDVIFMSYEPDCRLAPGGGGIVFASRDLAIHTLLPESVRPKEWNSDSMVTRYLWHDWKADAWREIGLQRGFTLGGDGFYEKMIQVRSDAVLAVQEKDDGPTVIESWPLPPRDPKWPALGVAALSMAGTWWGCARRYRRRMKLASNAMVTA